MKLNSQMKAILQRKKTELFAQGQKQGNTKQQCAVLFEFYLQQAEANIPIRYWDYKLEDLTWCPQAAKKMQKYIDKIETAHTKGIGLFLFGNNGLGKSLSAALVLQEALRKNYTARWSMLSELLALSSDGVYNKDAREAFRKEILEVDFLVVDDVDKTFVSQKSNYTNIHIDYLFRTRSNHCLPTLVTSNLPRDKIVTSDEQLSKSLLEVLQESLLDVKFPHKRSRRGDIQKSLEEEMFSD